MNDFADELAEGISTDSYTKRNPGDKGRVTMIRLSEYSDRRNLSIPEYVADRLRQNFESDRLAYKDATKLIDKLAEHTNDYSWHHNSSVSIYKASSSPERPVACINEIASMSDRQQYTAVLIDKGKEAQLAAGGYAECQKKIGEHFFLKSLDVVSKDIQREHPVGKEIVDCVRTQRINDLVSYAENQKIRVPEKTKERWEQLLSNGEKPENIRDYIEGYTKNISAPDVKISKPEIIKSKNTGMDL